MSIPTNIPTGGHRSFRKSLSPRHPHRAPVQLSRSGPQLSVVSTTFHLGSMQRRPGGRSLPSSPRAPAHAFGVPCPAAPRPRGSSARPFPAPARAQTALNVRRATRGGPRRFPGSAAPRLPPPASGSGRARLRRGAHLRAGGRLPRARQRPTLRQLRGPQRQGPDGLRVHARRPAAPRPGRRSAT